jgi:hypothetical protein
LTGRMDWGELLGTSDTKRTEPEGGALKKEPGYA